MAIVRFTINAISSPCVKLIKKNSKPLLINYDVIMATCLHQHQIRKLSTLEVTKNITLFSKRAKKPKLNANNLQLIEAPTSSQRPLVLLFSWMMARRKHIIKYADFYMNKGFDVINISVSPWQLLWPMKGVQIVASDVLKFLERNHEAFGPMLVHGFSVGGYVWSEALVKIDAERERYNCVVEKIRGQVWDSTADITEMPHGLPFAIFPNNKVLQMALKQYIIYHLKTFDKVATCHYIRASQMFHTTVVKAPAQFFVSKTDAIGTERSNKRVQEQWKTMGISTYWKCWDKSPHVGHFRQHPEEYKAQLERFIEVIGLPQIVESDVNINQKAKL